jgi:hypothetical protein
MCLFAMVILPVFGFPQGELTDHGGEDLIISEDITLYGGHLNINRFQVATSTTLSVALYDPEKPMTGRLTIRAQDIDVDGVINAFGAGYTGGGGGSKEVDEDTGEVILGGSGRYPGFTAQSSTGHYGDGDARGIHDYRNNISDGGYSEEGLNGDVSFDESLLMGSGGAGGDAWDVYQYAKGGGGGGGSGGGFVKLYAQNSAVITGVIITRGSLGENGGDGKYVSEGDDLTAVNGRGGNAWPYEEGVGGITVNSNSEALSEGYCGTRGGSGAGGGVLLRCDTPNALSVTGVIDARGERDDYTENGGTVKVFSPTPVEIDENNILSGRTVLFQTTAITDHEGEDLIITEDTTLFGEHININRFHVATSTTLSVALYDPATTMTGRLIIHAQKIKVNGVIDASGAGFTGGGGGQGSGYTGNVGHGRYPGFDGITHYGGMADGPAVAGGSGGYNEPERNTDQTRDESLLMGSGGVGGDGGGAGGDGDNHGPNADGYAGAGGGGGGGGSGGGYVKLFATEELVVTGKILTSGVKGGNAGNGDASTGICYWVDFPPPWHMVYFPGEGGKGGDAWPYEESLGGEGDDNPGCASFAQDGGKGFPGAGGGGFCSSVMEQMECN